MSDFEVHSNKNGPYFDIRLFYQGEEKGQESPHIILDGLHGLIKLRNVLHNLAIDYYPSKSEVVSGLEKGKKVETIQDYYQQEMTKCALCDRQIDDGHKHLLNDFDQADIRIKEQYSRDG